MIEQNDGQHISEIKDAYMQALEQKNKWQMLWDECYRYTLPQRNIRKNAQSAGKRYGAELYDGTAMDAAEQLSSNLLASLAPPWSAWFGFKPGPDLSDAQADKIAPQLERLAKIMQDHFERSNFAVEMHQAFLDLVIGGTASLMIEEAEPGAFSALRFSALPLQQFAVEEGDTGALDKTFRSFEMTVSQIKSRFSGAELPQDVLQRAEKDPEIKLKLLEIVRPVAGHVEYSVILSDEDFVIHQQKLMHSPFINFRWMKSPGEIYGRSPVMKALPDIKTANKVVELVLKNASIAVTGIWQADDDGVLNAANIELKPGAVIPKAVGSRGLSPLEMPGKFDVSELVLSDLRSRIRHALLADRLGAVAAHSMTATEVLERSNEMMQLLGATYGRLQSELLTPLVKRAFEILKRRGEIPDLTLDGRMIALEYRSPLAKAQGQRNIQSTLSWLQTVQAMGPAAAMAVDHAAAARFIGEALGVPTHLIKKDDSFEAQLGLEDGALSAISAVLPDMNMPEIGEGNV